MYSEITRLLLLKMCIRVSSCNLQKEHKGEGNFPKRNRTSLRQHTLLKNIRVLLEHSTKYNLASVAALLVLNIGFRKFAWLGITNDNDV